MHTKPHQKPEPEPAPDPDPKPTLSMMPATRQMKVIFGIDRLTLWIDQPELPFPTESLAGHCTKIILQLGQMRFNAQWKLKVELHQPTQKCLQLLLKGLGQHVSTDISYIEFACDIVPVDKNRSQHWRKLFLAEARMKYQRQSVQQFKTVWYYGRRSKMIVTDHATGMGGVKKFSRCKKRGSVLAVYADKPSKWLKGQPGVFNADRPCLHIEKRVSSSEAISRLGINSLGDLIELDNHKFWNEHVWMYRPIKPTPVGRFLAKLKGADQNVTGSALRKRGHKWKADHSINGQFVLHNALLETPILKRSLKQLPFMQWVDGLKTR